MLQIFDSIFPFVRVDRNLVFFYGVILKNTLCFDYFNMYFLGRVWKFWYFFGRNSFSVTSTENFGRSPSPGIIRLEINAHIIFIRGKGKSQFRSENTRFFQQKYFASGWTWTKIFCHWLSNLLNNRVAVSYKFLKMEKLPKIYKCKLKIFASKHSLPIYIMVTAVTYSV